MVRLFADEDFDYPIVVGLRRLGHDVLTTREAGKANPRTPDDSILASAVALRRAVLTHNRRHFMRLHRQAGTHLGIVVCTRDADSAALAARIDEALSNTPLLDNQLIRIIRPHRP